MNFTLKQIFGISFKFLRLNCAKMLPYMLIYFVLNEALTVSLYFITTSGAVQNIMQQAAADPNVLTATVTADQAQQAGQVTLLMSVALVFSLLWLFVIPRINLASLIYTKREFDGERLSFSQAMGCTYGKFLRYVGYLLLIFLVTIPGYTFVAPDSPPWFGIITTIYIFFVNTLFCLVAPLIALEGRPRAVIPQAIRMVSGFFPQTVVLMLIFAGYGVLALAGTVLDAVFAADSAAALLCDSAVNFCTAVILPLGAAVQVLIYTRQTHIQNPNISEGQQ